MKSKKRTEGKWKDYPDLQIRSVRPASDRICI